MTLHKLTAGDGYTYLTRQVAAQDVTERGRASLESYYSAKGESPGQWWGAGSAALGVAGHVSEAQMRALFGEGRHPDADQIMANVIAALPAGTSKTARTKAIDEATKLGRKFAVYPDTTPWRTRLQESYAEWHLANPGHQGGIPEDVRQGIRTTVGQQMFREEYQRAPLDDTELTAFVAQQSRTPTSAVAGFDLTFSPVKSISTLWAVAPRDVAASIEAAHDAAVERTLTWLQKEAGYTREGTRGIAQVETVGFLAAVFTHRDSRAGDPDLHTHVAVSTKVQAAESGKWLSLDARMLYRLNVAASEFYNSAMEAEVSARVGGRFAARADGIPGRRPVRELVGVVGKLNTIWSSRGRQIRAELARLQGEFRADHGRNPTAIEQIELAQRANLSTRQAKHAPRSMEEQREQWAQEAATALGGAGAVQSMVQAATAPAADDQYVAVNNELLTGLAVETVAVVQQSRGQWRESNLYAEALRQARMSGVDPAEYASLAAAVTARAVSAEHSIPIGMDDDLDAATPAELLRSNGESKFRMAGNQLYTSQAILSAEQRILAAAAAVGGPVVTEMDVELAQLEWSANNDGRQLNTSQVQMVTELATNSRRLQLALAPAGTGKTTVMGVLAGAAQSAGLNVVGLAPTAAAAQELSAAIAGVQGDTLDKLVYDISGGPGADPDRWYREIGRHTIVIIDEAGIASTPKLDAAARFIVAQGGRVILVGDDQQRAANGAGGILRNIEAEHGALTLTEVMRFTDPQVASASLALRAGDTSVTGFYTDRGLLHAVTAGTVVDQVYSAWQADVDAGAESIMIAPNLDLVAELNAKVRAHKLATGQLSGVSIEIPRTRELVSAGDIIVTKKNKRTLSLGSTDFVRNNYRWTVEEVRRDGSLRVKLLGRNLTRTLPAWYVNEGMVRLGYAFTEASVQGMTIGKRGRTRGTAHTIVGDSTDRNTLYVNLTRATDHSHAYVMLPGTGDGHDVITPGAVLPPTAIEKFTAAVSRDGTPLSVITQQQQAADPALRLGHATDSYTHSILTAAAATIGPQRMKQLEAAAVQILPSLRHAPAWDTLHSHLALIELQGGQAIARLQEAIDARELGTARDVAAVLDWRMDRTGNHSQDPGPLPWTPDVPSVLAANQQWGPYLQSSARRVSAFAQQVRERAGEWTAATAPVWAVPFLSDRPLVVDLAVWRAAQSVPDTDLRPAGDKPRTIAQGQLHQDLNRRAVAAVGNPADGMDRWSALLQAHSPALAAIVTADSYWPVLAARLSVADAAGLPVARLIDQAVNDRAPLPVEVAAGALWHRLAPHLGEAVAVPTAGHQLRPRWITNLQGVLGHSNTEQLISDRLWPAVVGRMDAYARTPEAEQESTAPAVMLTHAARMVQASLSTLQPHERTTALLWNLTTLTDPEPFDDEHPVPDPDQHDLQAPADVWELLNADIMRAADPSVRAPEPVGPDDHSDPFDPERLAPPAYLNEIPPVDLDQLDLADLGTLIDPYDLDWEPDLADLAALPIPQELAGPGGPVEPADPELQPADPETAAVPALAEAEHQAALARARAAIADAHAWWKTLTPQSWVPAYIAGRGLDPADFVFAPPGWTRTYQHLTSLGFTDNELLAAGLIRINSKGRVNDVFHGRAMLPLTDPDGTVVAFIGRKAPTDVDDRSPKYVNSPTTELYKKSSNLYGLNPDTVAAIRAGVQVVIVEGPMDAAAITAAAAGTTVAVATNGTALTMDHMRVLQQVGALGRGHILTLAFDGDKAGRAATINAHALFTDLDITDAQAVVWRDGKDASQLLEDHGPQAVRDALAGAQPLGVAVVRHHLAAAPVVLDQQAQRQLLAAVAPIAAHLDRQRSGEVVTEISQHLREHAAEGQAPDTFAVLDEIYKHLPAAPTPEPGPGSSGGLGLPAMPTRSGTTLTRPESVPTPVASTAVLDQDRPSDVQQVEEDLPRADEMSVVNETPIVEPAPKAVGQDQSAELQESVDDLDIDEDLHVHDDLPAAVEERPITEPVAGQDAPTAEHPDSAAVAPESSAGQPTVAVAPDAVSGGHNEIGTRLHDELPDAVLAERVAQKEHELARVVRTAEREGAQLGGLQAAVSAGRGPEQSMLQQRLAEDEERVAAGTRYRDLIDAARAEQAGAVDAAGDLGDAQRELDSLGRFAGRRRETAAHKVQQITETRDGHRARMHQNMTAAKELQARVGTPQQQERSEQNLRDREAHEAAAIQRDAALLASTQRAVAAYQADVEALREQLQELQAEQQLRRENPDQAADMVRQQAHQRTQDTDVDLEEEEIPGQREWAQDLADQELGYDSPDYDAFER